jgi:hypothetical protein
MTGCEILEYLDKEGYIVRLGDDLYTLSNKLKREQVSVIPEKLLERPKIPNECFATIEKFIKDCQIPFRAKLPQGSFYQLAAISDYARKYFYKLQLDKTYPYEDAVNATKKYYADTNMSRKTLTNYFKEGVFDQVMEEYSKNTQSVHFSSDKNVGRVSL